MKDRTKTMRPDNRRVDIALHRIETTPDVYWSPQKWRTERDRDGRERQEPAGGCNSYVALRNPAGEYTVDGHTVSLVSINGIGEIRWEVRKSDVDRAIRLEATGELNPSWDSAEHLGVARHFGVVAQKED